MKNLKKVCKFLISMKFAIVILIVFIVACIAGSVIPQGEIPAVYEASYPGWTGLIFGLKLDDVFHSWWFIVLTLLLCGNLLGCNLLHFPQILRRAKQAPKAPTGEALELRGDAEALFHQMGFRHIQEGDGFRYAIRNRIGFWGAWLTHLGLLIIIVGFALGQMFTVQYTVYGVPGESAQIGDTDYQLTIDDFTVTLREDNTVEQYTAALTLTQSSTGQTWSGTSSVNHPWNVEGMRLYQNSMGWAADVAVFKGDALLQQELLCVGEYFPVKDRPELLVSFRSFYPDYVVDANGMPATVSDRMENPGYLYALYYQDQVLGMNVLREHEKITVSDYTILFANPQYYTLIQIKRDPFVWLAGLGGAVLLVALYIAFYMHTEELWLVPAGENTWQVYGRSRKGNILYREKLTEKVEKINNGRPQ